MQRSFGNLGKNDLGRDLDQVAAAIDAQLECSECLLIGGAW